MDSPNRNQPGGAAVLFELLAMGRPAWQADAACREHPEVTWFSTNSSHQREAKAICQGCLVLEECRSWALSQGPGLVGVWGGLSTRERRRRRRQRSAA